MRLWIYRGRESNRVRRKSKVGPQSSGRPVAKKTMPNGACLRDEPPEPVGSERGVISFCQYMYRTHTGRSKFTVNELRVV